MNAQVSDSQIDFETGHAILGDRRVEVGPSLTFECFRSSSLTEQAEIRLPEAGCHHVLLHHTYHIREVEFMVGLRFVDGVLSCLILRAAIKEDQRFLFLAGWEHERKRARIHWDWFSTAVGNQRTFSWGTIEPVYEEVVDGACIWICYKESMRRRQSTPVKENRIVNASGAIWWRNQITVTFRDPNSKDPFFDSYLRLFVGGRCLAEGKAQEFAALPMFDEDYGQATVRMSDAPPGQAVISATLFVSIGGRKFGIPVRRKRPRSRKSVPRKK